MSKYEEDNSLYNDGEDKKKATLNYHKNNYVLIDPSKDLFDLKEALKDYNVNIIAAEQEEPSEIIEV